MDKRAAARKLKVPENADADTVRARFNAAIHAAHPDTGGTGEGVSELIEAKNTLLSGQDFACLTCGGSGTVRVFGAWRKCPRCSK